MKKYIVCMIALAAMAVACTKPIEFDGDVAEAKIVVQSEINAGENIDVRVCYSRFFLDSKPFKMVTNATVMLEVNGAPQAQGVYDAEEYCYHIGYKPQAGDSLLLIVRVPGHDEVVTAHTVVPKPTDISVGQEVLFHYDSNSYNSPAQGSLRLKLNDPEEEKNFYSILFYGTVDVVVINDSLSRIERVIADIINDTTPNEDSTMFFIRSDTVWRTDTIVVYDTIRQEIDDIEISVQDPAIIDPSLSDIEVLIDGDLSSYGEVIFNDSRLNHPSHELTLGLSIPYQYIYYSSKPPRYYVNDYDYYYDGYSRMQYLVESIRIYAEVVSYTRDLYLYNLSTEQQEEGESFFSDPVQIHDNIENGIGIFAAKNTVEIPVPIQIQ